MIIILENIRSILNVGSIFRTADAIGAEKIYLSGYTPGPDNQLERLMKTSLGAERSVAWERCGNILPCLEYLRAKDFTVVALETTPRAKNLFSLSRIKKPVLIFGNEVDGISDEVLSAADTIAHVPMRGSKESLNVAVAVGVAVYEVARRNDFLK